MIAVLYQGGLGLPERDYYLDSDPFYEHARQAYVRYLAALLDLWQGADSAHIDQARDILAFERELARVTMTPAEQRDPRAIYHPRTVQALAAEIPEIRWLDLFASHGLMREFPVNLAQPAFFARLGRLIAETDSARVGRYLVLQLLSGFAPYLSSAWVDAQFAFTKALTGTDGFSPAGFAPGARSIPRSGLHWASFMSPATFPLLRVNGHRRFSTRCGAPSGTGSGCSDG
ncbi:Peptidase M13 domain protein [mine drainage metagenome]|uniref:Peptidase M13 domain protein n=1 Tax=mine drainage metagenome TaxID=410659 RepID=T1BX83_9ZZZZ